MTTENHWYRNGDQKVGPFAFTTLKEIREKNGISDETLVSIDDGVTWTAYENILAPLEEAGPAENDNETKSSDKNEQISKNENIPASFIKEEPASTLVTEQKSVAGEDKTTKPKDAQRPPPMTAVNTNKQEAGHLEQLNEATEVEKSPQKMSALWHLLYSANLLFERRQPQKKSPLPQKKSPLRHLLYGFLIAFCFAFVGASIRHDFHLVTLSFFFNFNSIYFLSLARVFGGALVLFIIGYIPSLICSFFGFRSPTLFYILISVFGFLSIIGYSN